MKIYKSAILLITLGVLSTSGLFAESSESSKNYNIDQLQEHRLRLVEDAQAGSFDTRMKAISECGLGRIHYCLRALINNLEDSNPTIRRESIRGLGFLGMEEAVEPLLSQIKKLDKEIKENEEKQKSMLEKLKNEKDPTERSYYVTTIQSLEERHKNMLSAKGSAIWAIGNIEAEKAVENIKGFITDEKDLIRRVTAVALGEIGTSEVLPILEEAIKAEKKDRVKVDMLKAYLFNDPTKTEYINELIKMLADDEVWVRYYAALAVDDLNLFNAHAALKRALKIESDPMVRRALYKAYEKSMYH